MGLSFHYNGSFNPNASLQDMIDEVADICNAQQWRYHVYNTRFPAIPFEEDYDDEIYGISISPPGCEPVWLCFLSNGRMSSPMHLKFWGKDADDGDRELLYMLATKTQYAGLQVHAFVINLLKYINGKYLQNLQVTDEGGYWETGDIKILEENFNTYNVLLKAVGNAFENNPMREGENLDDYFERVLKDIKRPGV
jgi:hypothetical protein